MRRLAVALVLASGVTAACGSDAPPSDPDVAFPEDYASTFTEVRNCRKSGDHDLSFIRVLTDPAGLGPYLDRSTPFPIGAVVLKEEFGFGDATCSEEIVRWTVMRKNGTSNGASGWDWQSVSADRVVTGRDEGGCIGCHSTCTVGYDYTCTDP